VKNGDAHPNPRDRAIAQGSSPVSAPQPRPNWRRTTVSERGAEYDQSRDRGQGRAAAGRARGEIRRRSTGVVNAAREAVNTTEAAANTTAKKPRTSDRHKQPNRDRHRSGYWASHMHKRRHGAAMTRRTELAAKIHREIPTARLVNAVSAVLTMQRLGRPTRARWLCRYPGQR
jgi:hypothetical protein